MGKVRMITIANLVSFVMFAGIGLLTISLSLSGKLAMNRSEKNVTQMIQDVAITVTAFVQKIPGLDLVFFLFTSWLLYRFVKYILRK